MKRSLLFLIFSLFILLNCTSVEFETSVPKNIDSLVEFTNEMQGTYVNQESDTLVIDKYSFNYGRKNYTPLHLNKSISENEIEVKKFNEYHILNVREESSWTVVPVIFKENTIIVYYINIEEDNEQVIIDKLKTITSIIESYNSEGKVESYVINPTNTELKRMMEENVFSKILVFKKLQRNRK